MVRVDFQGGLKDFQGLTITYELSLACKTKRFSYAVSAVAPFVWVESAQCAQFAACCAGKVSMKLRVLRIGVL